MKFKYLDEKKGEKKNSWVEFAVNVTSKHICLSLFIVLF